MAVVEGEEGLLFVFVKSCRCGGQYTSTSSPHQILLLDTGYEVFPACVCVCVCVGVCVLHRFTITSV